MNPREGAGPSNASDRDEADGTLLYFEKQQAALCGLHALNTLMQGPCFTEWDLAKFAHDLDALERQLMAEGGVDGADFLQYAAEESGNVAASGMFSIQVLARALEVWGLAAEPLAGPAGAGAAADPQGEAAFVCNLQEHWFTIRRVGVDWWNFNSLFAAPEPLSPFYLAAFLASLQEQGYSIFVIRGDLPAAMRPTAGGDEGPGMWLTPAGARAEAQRAQQLKKSGFLQAAARGALDMASALGTRMSLRSGGAGVKRGHSEADDADLAQALAASRAELRGGSGGSGSKAIDLVEGDEEADLAAAIAASLAVPATSTPPAAGVAAGEAAPPLGPALPELGDEPEAGEGVREVGVRLPSGQRHSRRFDSSATVGHVAAFAALLGADMARHRLATSFPRAVLEDWAAPLHTAGVGNKQVLSAEPL